MRLSSIAKESKVATIQCELSLSFLNCCFCHRRLVCVLMTAWRMLVTFYSSWFDVDVQEYVQKDQKERRSPPANDDLWQLDDKSGAIFCVPKNDEFKSSFSSMPTKPYIFMQPPEGMPEGSRIIGAILEHRVAVLKGSKAKDLPIEEFHKLWTHRGIWIWPRTSDMGHLDSTNPNQALYTLSTEDEGKTVGALWKSIVAYLGTPEDSMSTNNMRRLPVFKAMKGESAETEIPRLKRVSPVSIHDFASLSIEEATWRELILGEGGINGGYWEQSIQSQAQSPRRNSMHYGTSSVSVNSRH